MFSPRHVCACYGPAGALTNDGSFRAFPHLEAGRLFAPFPDMLVESGKYYLLTRSGSMTDAASAVLSWLAALGCGGDHNTTNSIHTTTGATSVTMPP
ncbi:hypothetical protein [Massilia sp. METH4]|uniref:hypothetical protein n=1 Tax=Massilia sp. METH4 TaxID=3123041 RepID=UPI0030CCC129